MSEHTPVLLVEGESDVWAALAHGSLAVGVPGATTWRPEFALPLTRFRNVFLWQEPGLAAEHLVRRVAGDLPHALVLTGDDQAKDICQLHECSGTDFLEALEVRIQRAVPVGARAAALIARSPALPRTALRRDRSGVTHAPDVVERARRRDLVAVMQAAHVEFAPNSRTRARCPFHPDQRPSLSVNPAKGVWRCHGCDAKGDVISFVMQHRRVSFRIAVEELGS